ncbi:MAG TPA: hypothetical protein VMV18_02895 [bacterium]|nr:hypothetical protein [bacterium]
MSGNGRNPIERLIDAVGGLSTTLRSEMAELRDRMDAHQLELSARLDLVNAAIGRGNDRLDRLVENTGGHWRDLDRRVSTLEARAKKPPSDD